MDAQETVLKAYKYFGEADMENLATLYNDDYVFYMNGMHRLSGQYHGFGIGHQIVWQKFLRHYLILILKS